jgi:hypothetical protein
MDADAFRRYEADVLAHALVVGALGEDAPGVFVK